MKTILKDSFYTPNNNWYKNNVKDLEYKKNYEKVVKEFNDSFGNGLKLRKSQYNMSYIGPKYGLVRAAVYRINSRNYSGLSWYVRHNESYNVLGIKGFKLYKRHQIATNNGIVFSIIDNIKKFVADVRENIWLSDVKREHKRT
jgi:hypothetical protein